MMNPIDFLKQNGYDPDTFRAPAPQWTAPRECAAELDNTPRQTARDTAPAKRRFPRRRNIADVRTELCNEYLATGNKDLTGLFVPWLMADIVNIINSKYLCLKGTFRHKEREHYSGMMDCWYHFNQDLLVGFKGERREQVETMIDDFGDYIANEVELFRISIVSSIRELDGNFRNLCGALCVCKLMISQARRAWDGMYKSQKMRNDAPTQRLKSMEHHIIELLNEFFKRETRLQEDVNLAQVESVRSAEETTVKKILKFIKEYDGQQSNG